MISKLIAPAQAAKGLIGSAPTVFWGEAYANCGSAGVFLVAVPVGFCVCLLQTLTTKLPASPVAVGLMHGCLICTASYVFEFPGDCLVI